MNAMTAMPIAMKPSQIAISADIGGCGLMSFGKTPKEHRDGAMGQTCDVLCDVLGVLGVPGVLCGETAMGVLCQSDARSV
jgi:hypothetical protein